MRFLIGFYLLASCGLAAHAASIHVDPFGTGDYPNIQAAITAASSGDTVALARGVYTGGGNRDVDFLGKQVVLRSIDGDPSGCVINSQGGPVQPPRFCPQQRRRAGTVLGKGSRSVEDWRAAGARSSVVRMPAPRSGTALFPETRPPSRAAGSQSSGRPPDCCRLRVHGEPRTGRGRNRFTRVRGGRGDGHEMPVREQRLRKPRRRCLLLRTESVRGLHLQRK